MIYLADTHALIWYLNEDQRLSATARTIFEKAEQGEASIIITTISLLELFYVCTKRNLFLQFTEILRRLHQSINYVVYDLDLSVVMACTKLGTIEEMHDRIITATAKLIDATVITVDKNIRDSGYVAVLW